MNLGAVLRELREGANLTQSEAAEHLATIPAEISRMENNQRTVSKKMITRISEFYKISVPMIFFKAIMDESEIKPEDLDHFRETKPAIEDWMKYFFS